MKQMKKISLLASYPNPKNKRYVDDNLRTIKHRIVASYRDKEFYDGERIYGYGGFKYDGRWKDVAEKFSKKYRLKNGSSILQLSSKKGFLLHDFKVKFSKINVCGLETSDYAIRKTLKKIKKDIKKVDTYTKLNFKNNSFDLVIALGVPYEYGLDGAIACLKEIQRVSKGNSFITLGSYRTKKEFWQLRQWTLLGVTLLKEKEWREVLRHVKYTGDYEFVNAKNLNLISKK
jgi:hypothetical protein|tara:strand:- start:2847 stop:3539 length:693 start_codon:yes stop_codon:yes gene_type:complete